MVSELYRSFCLLIEKFVIIFALEWKYENIRAANKHLENLTLVLWLYNCSLVPDTQRWKARVTRPPMNLIWPAIICMPPFMCGCDFNGFINVLLWLHDMRWHQHTDCPECQTLIIHTMSSNSKLLQPKLCMNCLFGHHSLLISQRGDQETQAAG